MTIQNSIDSICETIQSDEFLPKNSSNLVRRTLINNIINSELRYDTISDQCFQIILDEAYPLKLAYYDDSLSSCINKMIYDVRAHSNGALFLDRVLVKPMVYYKFLKDNNLDETVKNITMGGRVKIIKEDRLQNERIDFIGISGTKFDNVPYQLIKKGFIIDRE